MAKTVLNTIVSNKRTIDGMQKRRNSSIVTIVGQEHSSSNGDVYFAMSPDMAIISELRFKVVCVSGSFSNVTLDDSLSLGWSGSGVAPDRGHEHFYDLLASISGTSFASSLFDGGVHKLHFTGGGQYKVLLYAKYSTRNR